MHTGFLHTALTLTPCKLYDCNFDAAIANMRYLLYTLSLWIALALGTQSTQNNDAAQTDDSIATPPPPPPPLRLADIQQCPAAPKPSCDDPNCQGARHQCATQYLCSSEDPFFTDPSSSSSSSSCPSSGRQVILAGCRCCPLPIHIECTDTQCAAAPAPAPASRVCAAEPLRGCTCQTADDRFRAAQERAAGWVWPLDKNDEAYDVDIESDSGDEDEARAQAQPEAQPAGSSVSSSSSSSSSSAGPPPHMATTTNMATVPPLALLLRDYYAAMEDQADLKFLVRRD